ncbi:unnamed protein product [Polarella glacialis]|uniref:Uncharacterized protein n=1 Tax=Polarella glacialis TaxID=89957 RepID=A0A813DDK3_POLGL|nr:unnamed protein product [Polarella glacialis]
MPSDGTKSQRHAQRFRECSAPHAVLQKYLSTSKEMETRELLRHISHVCAWVALAQPLPDAAKRLGPTTITTTMPTGSNDNNNNDNNQNLSPVRLLSKMLRLRGRARLDDRVRVALEAVASCCKVALGSDPSCNSNSNNNSSSSNNNNSNNSNHDNNNRYQRADWLELKSALPRFQKRHKAEMEPQSGDACFEAADVLMFKRVGRLNDGICRWQHLNNNTTNNNNSDLLESLVLVADRKERLAETLQGADIDTLHLRKLLYEVIGALSPPRSTSQASDQMAPLDDLAAERLQKGAAIQKSVREILARGILAWRTQLQLEDLQIEPILGHVRNLIQEVEGRHIDVQHACEGKQWSKLKEAVGLTEAVSPAEGMIPGSQEEEQQQKRKHGTGFATEAKSHRSIEAGRYTPNAQIQALDCVVDRPQCEEVLLCTGCGLEVFSFWYVRRLRRKDYALLRPINGHRKAGFRCGDLKPISATVSSVPDNLQYARMQEETVKSCTQPRFWPAFFVCVCVCSCGCSCC